MTFVAGTVLAFITLAFTPDGQYIDSFVAVDSEQCRSAVAEARPRLQQFGITITDCLAIYAPGTGVSPAANDFQAE